ncbi:NAD dependent epimerase/dehydratase family protein [Flexibacter flexilis DSM 6793]|uniref:NAD dependent epimerase/dehydratase family protein n=1 Tax=Flexibacter flexilis DSM 6793 TaxID=927664 RepID=A0A1I1L124_9BACT|nr:NAD-dependent epimerase/dehydratase family protein [Flexibacter flexilis]SFC64103.1 NAD dependent epimerase/dehydratase family protein [Flexibacter flexilis DSM 6793]
MKVIITGASGMVGEGVLHECLQHPAIEQVLVVGRKTCGVTHPKLKEVLHSNFFDLKDVEPYLVGYDACFFCLGVSSVGMKEPEYTKLTHTLTLNFAQTILRLNPSISFSYISGAGTDSSEKGSSMWARVKGCTENDLKKLPFKKVYNFRPGYLQPTAGLKNTLPMYKYLGWLFPALRLFLGKYVSTLQQLGQAMINATLYQVDKDTPLEVPDILELAKR